MSVVEVVHRVVIEEVATTHPRFQLAHPGDELPVALQKPIRRIPVAENEGVTDEQLPRRGLVDAVVADRASGDDRQAVQRHRLRGDGAALRRSQRGSLKERLTRWAPMRSAHSGWIDATRRAQHAIRLDELGRHHPPWGPFGQHRTRSDDERRAA